MLHEQKIIFKEKLENLNDLDYMQQDKLKDLPIKESLVEINIFYIYVNEFMYLIYNY